MVKLTIEPLEERCAPVCVLGPGGLCLAPPGGEAGQHAADAALANASDNSVINMVFIA